MASVLITYDLITPGKNYAELHEAIKALGSWWHCVESTWIVKSNLTLVQIRDALNTHVDSNDKLLVLGLSGAAAWVGLDKNCSDWLTNNL
ncbi:hypothetical protein [Pseudomonas fluorescens]|uniref:SinR family protein n=1 Tax=Pseudomonas fluorescens TaxID=294 RepID=A0AAE2AX55_PSEFL|nr:hypothetical protein [Pseudomonas fluorescens]KIP93520.1 SinR family protein [Pseudomonas fluorescens]